MRLFVPLLLAALVGLACPQLGAAQGATENAEARVYFEEGNRLYEQARRASPDDRAALLQRALEAYVDSLRIARSRNALFNAAIVLSELGRYDESFNYLSEYLGVEGLSDEDRAEAHRRRDALRAHVAVLRAVSVPEEAKVWIDRKDLAPRGVTPLELALPPGDHRLFVEREGFVPLQRTFTTALGRSVTLTLALEPVPLAAPPEPPPPASVPTQKRPRLRNAAIGTAAGTLAAAGAAIGLSVKARSLRDDYDQAAAAYRESGDPADFQRAQELADRTDRFNLAADVLWGTTIALGVSAIVLYAVHRKKEKRDVPEVAVTATRRGGYASVKLSFGGIR